MTNYFCLSNRFSMESTALPFVIPRACDFFVFRIFLDAPNHNV